LAVNSAAKPTNSLWTITSDRRIKQNVEDANLAICYDNIKNVKLRRFEWNPEYYDRSVTKDRKVLGFVAQEVMEAFPKAVDVLPTQQFVVKQYDEDGMASLPRAPRGLRPPPLVVRAPGPPSAPSAVAPKKALFFCFCIVCSEGAYSFQLLQSVEKKLTAAKN
jgi:Chaperone of endosialidase